MAQVRCFVDTVTPDTKDAEKLKFMPTEAKLNALISDNTFNCPDRLEFDDLGRHMIFDQMSNHLKYRQKFPNSFAFVTSGYLSCMFYL